MDTNAINEFVKEIELFKDLSDEELQLLTTSLEQKAYKSKTMVFSENGPRRNLYLIFDGEIELYKTTPFGEEKRLAFFRKFDFLGERSLG